MSLPDDPASLARDIALVARLSAVPALLQLVCEHTGMGFAAVARVSERIWVACAVEDRIGFGLKAGGHLDVDTTLCVESRASVEPIVIDDARTDPVYAQHHTMRMYGLQSYISVPIVRRDGEYFGNLCAVDPAPHKVSDDKTVALFQGFANLVALQMEMEEQQARTESTLSEERANRLLREEFIAVLGHDLRNPIASVGAAADALAMRQAQPELVRLGKRLRHTSRRMSKLIDDVLDLDKGRRGTGMHIVPEIIDDLGTTLMDVVMELRETYPRRVVLHHFYVEGVVYADRGRLQQLVSNLLTNALAYGDPDRPVKVSAVLQASALVLTVANEGEPIRADHLPHLFEPYWRPADSRPGGGLGLGLYICAQIAKAHGGEVQVSSAQGLGTFFMVQLPVCLSH